MKKHLILSIMLAIISLIGVVSGASYIEHIAVQNSYTQETLQGDISEVDGIEIKSIAVVDEYLQWTMNTKLGENPQTTSEFLYSDKRIREENDDVTLHVSFDGYCEEIHDYMRSITEVGETRKEILYYSDFYEYYPLEIYLSNYYNGNSEIREIIEEYFKFPIEKNDAIEIEFTRGSETSSSSSTSTADGSEGLMIDSQSFWCDNGLYFIIKAYLRNTDGEALNVAYDNIKDGFGMYYIPSDESGNLLFDEMKNIYPIKEENNIYATIELSRDKNCIYVFEEYIDGCYMSVFDVNTQKEIQRIKLDLDSIFYSIIENDCIAVIGNDSKFTLFKINEDGTLTEVFTGENTLIDENYVMLDSTNTRIKLDGERLIAVTTGWYYGNRYYVGIFTEDGVEYIGRYNSSMDILGYESYSTNNYINNIKDWEIILGNI